VGREFNVGLAHPDAVNLALSRAEENPLRLRRPRPFHDQVHAGILLKISQRLKVCGHRRLDLAD